MLTTLARSAVIGLAAGGRSTLGLVPLAGASTPRRVVGALVVTELVADKLPAAPSRLRPGPLLGRAGAGALGASLLARRGGESALLPAATGAAAALAGSLAGSAFREIAADRGWSGWRSALAEDAVVVTLALAAAVVPDVPVGRERSHPTETSGTIAAVASRRHRRGGVRRGRAGRSPMRGAGPVRR